MIKERKIRKDWQSFLKYWCGVRHTDSTKSEWYNVGSLPSFFRKFWAGPCRAFWPLPKSLCWWRPKARCLWFVTQVSRFRARLEPAEPPSQRQEIRPGFQRTDCPTGVTAFSFSALLTIFRTKKTSAFLTNVQPRMHISCSWCCPGTSAPWRACQLKKVLQGSEAETRELMGGTE